MITRYCKSCKKTFDTDGSPTPACSHCGTVYEGPRTPNYLELQARLYGTPAVPVWNVGLGTYTTGKSDWRRKCHSIGARPHDE